MIRRAWHRATRTWREAAAIIADVQAPAPGNTRVPAPSPVPGQQEAPVPAHGRPPRPAPAPACRWCDGTGWAVVLDHVLEDAYSIACPGGCPIPSGWAVPEVPF